MIIHILTSLLVPLVNSIINLFGNGVDQVLSNFTDFAVFTGSIFSYAQTYLSYARMFIYNISPLQPRFLNILFYYIVTKTLIMLAVNNAKLFIKWYNVLKW